jgi:hypothetical protein
MLGLMVALKPLLLDLASTRDEVLATLAEDVKTHICNDGF